MEKILLFICLVLVAVCFCTYKYLIPIIDKKIGGVVISFKLKKIQNLFFSITYWSYLGVLCTFTFVCFSNSVFIPIEFLYGFDILFTIVILYVGMSAQKDAFNFFLPESYRLGYPKFRKSEYHIIFSSPFRQILVFLAGLLSLWVVLKFLILEKNEDFSFTLIIQRLREASRDAKGHLSLQNLAAILTVLSVLVLYVLWVIRDKNKADEIENHRKDINLKDFQQLNMWATGQHFKDVATIDKDTHPQIFEQQYDGAMTLKIASIHQLIDFANGKFGKQFKLPARELLLPLLTNKTSSEIDKQVGKEIEKNGKQSEEQRYPWEIEFDSLFNIRRYNFDGKNNLPTLLQTLYKVIFEVLPEDRSTNSSFSGFNTTYINPNKPLDCRYLTLSNTKWNACVLKNVDFKSADLSDAEFRFSSLENVNFNGAKLENPNMPFEGYYLKNVSFNFAVLDFFIKNSHFNDVKFKEAKIKRNITSSIFSNCNFTKCLFEGYLHNVEFDRHCTFHEATIAEDSLIWISERNMGANSGIRDRDLVKTNALIDQLEKQGLKIPYKVKQNSGYYHS